MEYHVDAICELGKRLLFAGADIIPVSDVGGNDACLRFDVVHALGKSAKALPNRRQFGTTDDTDAVRVCHGASNHAGQVRWLGEPEDHAGDVGRNSVAGGDDVLSPRVIRGDSACRILKLEAVPEDKLVSLVAVLPEVLLELGRSFRLDMADLSAQ